MAVCAKNSFVSKEESFVMIWNDFFSAYFCFGNNRNKIILMLSLLGRFYGYVGCLTKVMYGDSFLVKFLRSYAIATMSSNRLVCGGSCRTINHPMDVGWLIVIATRTTHKTVEIDEYMHIIFYIYLID